MKLRIPSLHIVALPLLVVAALFMLSATTVFAASEADLNRQQIALTPSNTDISVAPGKSYSDSVKVINQGTESFDVDMSVAPYHVTNMEYIPQFTQLEGAINASKWVKLDKTTRSDIRSSQIFEARYTVTVPENAEPGGYYAVIFAQSTPSELPAEGVVQHNRVGNILYITVEGDVKTAGALKEKELPFLSFGGTVPIAATLQNTGGVHFKSKYTVSIQSVFGGAKAYNDEREYYVLPQTERDVASQWKTSAWFGIYNVSISAELPGGTEETPTRTIVIVNPWLALILFLAVILLIASFLVKSEKVKGKKRKAVR